MKGGFFKYHQSEHIIDHDSHFEFPISTKNSNFVQYYLINIHIKCGSNGPFSFEEEY